MQVTYQYYHALLVEEKHRSQDYTLDQFGYTLQRKTFRGMGFKDFEIFNLAMLANQAWRLLINPNSLVSEILKAKYFPHSDIIKATRRYSSSFAWQSILEGLDFFKKGVSFTEGSSNPRLIGDNSGSFSVK